MNRTGAQFRLSKHVIGAHANCVNCLDWGILDALPNGRRAVTAR